MTYEEVLRMLILTGIIEKMSDEEKKAFALLQGKSSDKDVIEALKRQNIQLNEISQKVSKHHWLGDFGANIAGNAAYGAAIWLLEKLLKSTR